ncbi:transposase [Rugamonas sp. FT103W]|uniref:Transposase n=1 Tax=Rugamonas rivuli TaxID=2743358 RepID=A0A843SD53_9BURK|nr:transposase [Rugamonas rivuli]
MHATLSRKSDVAAIMYQLKLWPTLTLYAADGRIEIDNSAAERTLRGVARGCSNVLFPASTAVANAPPCTG